MPSKTRLVSCLSQRLNQLLTWCFATTAQPPQVGGTRHLFHLLDSQLDMGFGVLISQRHLSLTEP